MARAGAGRRSLPRRQACPVPGSEMVQALRKQCHLADAITVSSLSFYRANGRKLRRPGPPARRAAARSSAEDRTSDGPDRRGRLWCRAGVRIWDPDQRQQGGEPLRNHGKVRTGTRALWPCGVKLQLLKGPPTGPPPHNKCFRTSNRPHLPPYTLALGGSTAIVCGPSRPKCTSQLGTAAPYGCGR